MVIEDPNRWTKDTTTHHIPSLRPRIEIIEVTDDTLNRFIKAAMEEDVKKQVVK